MLMTLLRDPKQDWSLGFLINKRALTPNIHFFGTIIDTIGVILALATTKYLSLHQLDILILICMVSLMKISTWSLLFTTLEPNHEMVINLRDLVWFEADF